MNVFQAPPPDSLPGLSILRNAARGAASGLLISGWNTAGRLAYEVNKFNPIANIANGFWIAFTGHDSYGVPGNGWDAATNFLCAVPLGTVGKMVVGESTIAFKETANLTKSWLGEEAKVITNKAGDNIFISKDGLRKIRFDLKNSQGDLPHIHLEEFINGKWRDAIKGTHRIYPKQ